MIRRKAEGLGSVDKLLLYPERYIAQAGLPVPSKLPEITDRDQFPLDITKVSDEQVRHLLSYWTAQYAYANRLLGLEQGHVAILTRLLERKKLVLFNKYKPDRKSSDWSEAIKGRIAQNTLVHAMELKLARAEGVVSSLWPLVQDFKAYADTASREITARTSERDVYNRSDGTRRRKGLH